MTAWRAGVALASRRAMGEHRGAMARECAKAARSAGSGLAAEVFAESLVGSEELWWQVE